MWGANPPAPMPVAPFSGTRTEVEDTVAAMMAGWPEHIRALVYCQLYREGVRYDTARETVRKAFG